MMRPIAGIFIIAHGLVHAWYLTLSQGWVEFQADMGWSGRSWLLSGLFGEGVTRPLSSALYLSAGVGLIVGGVGLIAQTGWAGMLLMISAVFSAGVILLFWDGRLNMIVQKGLLGLLINQGILVVLFAVK